MRVLERHEPQPPQRIAGAGDQPLVAHVPQQQLVGNAAGEKLRRRVVRAVEHPAAPSGRTQRAALYQHLARALASEARQHARERALPRAVSARERHHLTGPRAKRHVFPDRMPAATAREPTRLEGGGRPVRRCPRVLGTRKLGQRDRRRRPQAEALPLARGKRLHLGRRPLPAHLSPFEVGVSIGDARQPRQPMLRHQHGAARGFQLRHLGSQQGRPVRIEVRRGLVAHEDARAGSHGRRHRHPLLLTA